VYIQQYLDETIELDELAHIQLGDTYSRLVGQWMPANGREPKSAPALEVYLNSPNDTPPADLVTEISIPLAD